MNLKRQMYDTSNFFYKTNVQQHSGTKLIEKEQSRNGLHARLPS